MLFQTTLPITNSRTRTQEQNTAKSARNIKKPHLFPRIKSPKRTIKNRNFHELKGGKTEEITKNRKEKKKQGGSRRAHLLRRLRGRRHVGFRRRRRRVRRGGGGEVVHGDGTWARERERDPTSGVCHWQRYHKGEKDFLFPSCTNTPVLLIKFHFSPPL